MQVASLRKKHNDAVAELTDQLEQLQKMKVKVDKDKAQLLRDLEDANANADAENRQKQEFEKQAKMTEMQLSELQAKADEQVRHFQRVLLQLQLTIPLCIKNNCYFCK